MKHTEQCHRAASLQRVHLRASFLEVMPHFALNVSVPLVCAVQMSQLVPAWDPFSEHPNASDVANLGYRCVVCFLLKGCRSFPDLSLSCQLTVFIPAQSHQGCPMGAPAVEG